MRMLGHRKRLSRRQMLESTPRLNPAVRWKELESGKMLAAYERHAHGPMRLLMRLAPTAAWSELMLDEVGSAVVRRIDGRHTVADLIAFVAAEHKLNRKEAEVALLKYMETLGRRNLVGFELRRVREES